jgi:hypothetical protein
VASALCPDAPHDDRRDIPGDHARLFLITATGAAPCQMLRAESKTPRRAPWRPGHFCIAASLFNSRNVVRLWWRQKIGSRATCSGRNLPIWHMFPPPFDSALAASLPQSFVLSVLSLYAHVCSAVAPPRERVPEIVRAPVARRSE